MKQPTYPRPSSAEVPGCARLESVSGGTGGGLGGKTGAPQCGTRSCTSENGPRASRASPLGLGTTIKLKVRQRSGQGLGLAGTGLSRGWEGAGRGPKKSGIHPHTETAIVQRGGGRTARHGGRNSRGALGGQGRIYGRPTTCPLAGRLREGTVVLTVVGARTECPLRCRGVTGDRENQGRGG